MSINKISMFSGANAYLNMNMLPEYIIQKLLALGINPKDVATLNEANNLIAQAESGRSQINNTKINETEEQNNNDADNSLMERARKLASRLGVQYLESDSIDDIISKIQDAINKLLNIAESRGDMDLAEKLLGFQHELDRIIEAKNGGGEVSNEAVYNVLDIIAEQNKYALGLN